MIRITSFVVLLLTLALSGCPTQTHLESRLYVIQASGGVFTPTEEDGVYTLITGGIRDEVTWFSDRPWRDAGEEDLSSFVGETWPGYFESEEPAAGLAVRSSDGVWSILTAQIHDAVYDADEATLTWTVRLHGTPDLEPQTGVLVYLDDKGALEADDESHVFLHAAAQAEFTESKAFGPGQYRLTLAYPLPELIVLEVAPGYNAALERIDHFIDTSWPLDFDTDPPNAVVTIEDAEGNLESTPVVLSDPQWDAETDTLSYLARPLAGTPPAFVGPATVYIDSWDDRDDMTIYQVVVNHEEQYSIWPAQRELPLGWDSVGVTGTKEECLAYIEEVWTDMRPLSLRKKMEEAGLG